MVSDNFRYSRVMTMCIRRYTRHEGAVIGICGDGGDGSEAFRSITIICDCWHGVRLWFLYKSQSAGDKE